MNAETAAIATVLLLGPLGAFCIWRGATVLNGTYKRWILSPNWHRRVTLFTSPSWDHPSGGVEIGLILVTLGFALIEICVVLPLVSISGLSALLWGGVLILGTMVAGILLGTVGLKRFHSHWAFWLERNYWDKLDIMIIDIRRDPDAWEGRVATQAGLEEWAREVAGEPLSAGCTCGIPQATGHRRITWLDEDKRESAKESIRSAVKSFNPGEQFTISDLERVCQGIDRGTVLQVLVQLRAQGLVECAGRGLSARWRRV